MEEYQDHIIKTFREGLAHHEVAVSDSVWAGVQATMASKAAVSGAAVSTSFIKAASVVGVSAVVGLGAYNEIDLHRADNTVEPKSVEKTEKITAVNDVDGVESAVAVNDKTWEEAVDQAVSGSLEAETIESDAEGQPDISSEMPEPSTLVDESEVLAENTEQSDAPAEDSDVKVVESSNTSENKEEAEHNEPTRVEQDLENNDDAADENTTPPPAEEKEEEQTCALHMTHAAKAFISPDGDGTNECFSAEGSESAASFKVTIWTRSGDLLFESTDPNFKWCGEDRFGNLVENRTMCYYKIDAFDEKGLQYKKPNARGSVQVFR
ncbi:MAG: hypothetical protein Salg2KO_06440 [Salibacteraceae bacterium]